MKALFVWVFPVFFLDAFFNRDPFYKLDSHFTIGTTCAGCSWFLSYSNRTLEDYTKSQWVLDNITYFGYNDDSIIGKSPKGFFIADRNSEEISFFSDGEARDKLLREKYHRERADFKFEPSFLMEMKNNLLWPYVHIYYALCFILIPLLKGKQPKVNSRANIV